MIDFDTKTNNYSLLDYRFSNVEDSRYKEQIIISALESEVDKRLKILDESDTEIEFQFNDEYQELPKYHEIIGLISKSYFGLTQHWIGVVESIDNESFIAKLDDKTNKCTYEMATFEISEVSLSDRPLLAKGAVFYWSVGFATENGQIEKRSLLRFKRSIDFTEDDLDFINDKAKFYNNNINWD